MGRRTERRRCHLLVSPAHHVQAASLPSLKSALECKCYITLYFSPTRKVGRSGPRVMGKYVCIHSISQGLYIWYFYDLLPWKEKVIREVRLICIHFSHKSKRTR